MANITFLQAIHDALLDEMRRNSRMIIMGQIVRGGTGFPVPTEGLWQEFGDLRVFDTPISENAMAGSAVGLALAGYTAVCDLGLSAFIPLVADEMMYKAGRWRYMHNLKQPLHLVYLSASGLASHGAGPEHSDSGVGQVWHTPGLKLVAPSNPYDCKGLLKSALRSGDPVVFMGNVMLYGTQGEVPDEEYTIPLGEAKIVQPGSDVSVAALGYMVPLAQEAAEIMAREKVSVEVIDLRCLEPLDMETVEQSVRKTGRAVVVEEDFLRCGPTAELAAQVTERAWGALKAPVLRVATADVPHPASPPLIQAILPSANKIAEAIRRVVDWT